jgi:hypothetical protein
VAECQAPGVGLLQLLIAHARARLREADTRITEGLNLVYRRVRFATGESSAVSAMTCAVGAACAYGAWGRASCRRQPLSPEKILLDKLGKANLSYVASA